MALSSRASEGEPNTCPICGRLLPAEQSPARSEARCPHCGELLIFGLRSDGLALPAKLDSRLADELVGKGILTQWQADMLVQGKFRGFNIGNYRILCPLGKGRICKVFLAEHTLLNCKCALKVLPTRYGEDRNCLDRLRNEACAITRLAHRNIIRIYELSEDSRYGRSIKYLAMEYVEGRDLRRAVAEGGPMGCSKAVDVIRQAADGLSYAHQEGIIHRNIQPENLLLDPSGVVKIIDFGDVLHVAFPYKEQQPWRISEGERLDIETADYVAPEQIADSGNIDGRADIYSLGLTFYYLLTGRRPYPKTTLVELLMAHRAEQPEPIGKSRPDVPLPLINIIERMTAKVPGERYPKAADVADALQFWLNDAARDRGNDGDHQTPEQ